MEGGMKEGGGGDEGYGRKGEEMERLKERENGIMWGEGGGGFFLISYASFLSVVVFFYFYFFSSSSFSLFFSSSFRFGDSL